MYNLTDRGIMRSSMKFYILCQVNTCYELYTNITIKIIPTESTMKSAIIKSKT
jgi:hypothetical protein